MSVFVFAGSMQYVAVNLFTTAFNPVNAFFMTLMVNARHLFYGLSMLKRFKDTGRKKPYLVFGLTDETFSIVCSTEPPEGIDRGWFMFFVTLLNQIYWVAASAIGGMLGSMFSFSTKGIDFVMTALFVVIFVNQWQAQKNHVPALVGVGVSLICRLLFGADRFIIPAMILIIAVFSLFRKQVERGTGE
jgi:4-azaleucine resistance transporter AzlC